MRLELTEKGKRVARKRREEGERTEEEESQTKCGTRATYGRKMDSLY